MWQKDKKRYLQGANKLFIMQPFIRQFELEDEERAGRARMCRKIDSDETMDQLYRGRH